MAIINRASLPEEFYDITSASLLVQPEPQYLHATLYKLCMGAGMQLAMGGGAGLPIGNRAIPSHGADYTSVDYDRLAFQNLDPTSSNAFTVVPEIEQGPKVGHTIRVNRPKFATGGFTEAARAITSGATISVTPIDLGSEQMAITVRRFGGPYDSVAGNVAPYALDRFDAAKSVHSLVQMIGKHMQRDFDHWLDTVVSSIIDLASNTIWPTGFTTDDGSLVAGDMPLDVDTIFRAEETLLNLNIPRFSDGTYMGIFSPTQIRQLKNDSAYKDYAKFAIPEKNPLYTSFIQKIGNVRVYQSTTLNSVANTHSVNVTRGQVFGPGILASGVADLPRVMPSTDDNYGESAKLVWLAYMAFALADSRFGVSVRTS